jgi:hypothetical protein
VVEHVSDEAVEILLKVTDGKKVSSTSLEFTEGRKYFIVLKCVTIPQGNGGDEAWTVEWAIPATGLTDAGDRGERIDDAIAKCRPM